MFGRLLGWYAIYTFLGLLPLTEFCQVQNSLYVQVLRSHILAALLHGTPAAGASQTLRSGTRNGITELSQRAPPICGWAAITLGIGPHCSCILFASEHKLCILNSRTDRVADTCPVITSANNKTRQMPITQSQHHTHNHLKPATLLKYITKPIRK